MPARLTLVLGGARSGKSAHAEALARGAAAAGVLPAYVATAEALDAEMAERIARHRADRDGQFETFETTLDLGGTLLLAAARGAPVLVDCLTLWITNLMVHERDIAAAVADFGEALDAVDVPVVLVANEVGLGIVPDNAMARRFRDEAGRLNQRLAARAETVLFIAAGLPLRLKG